MTEEIQDARLPVHLWIDAQLRPLADRGIYYYIRQRGERNTGVILLKLNGLLGECRLLVQQRDLDGALGWMNALGQERVEETAADAYIQRTCQRDPDLWVIEIEDKAMDNPFEGAMISL
ncbi:MAG: DUF1491 family protein [Alphaproteobacteria bacterium]